jgi:hypothetical protein
MPPRKTTFPERTAQRRTSTRFPLPHLFDHYFFIVYNPVDMPATGLSGRHALLIHAPRSIQRRDTANARCYWNSAVH